MASFPNQVVAKTFLITPLPFYHTVASHWIQPIPSARPITAFDSHCQMYEGLHIPFPPTDINPDGGNWNICRNVWKPTFDAAHLRKQKLCKRMVLKLVSSSRVCR
jgi:hypothetical protein